MFNSFDVETTRKQFPIFSNTNIIYLDNASTTQKPQRVIDKMVEFYSNYNANIHRSIYNIGYRATLEYEKTRQLVQEFINSQKTDEIIFTKGCTESINLVASSLGKTFKPGDEIILTQMEHHSNMVPWRLLAQENNLIIKYIQVNQNGELEIGNFEQILSAKTKLVAVTHASNTLGTINDIKKIAKIAHNHDSLVLVDGAQAAGHMEIDVQDLGCDFYAFSGHKMYGPDGVGVLYAKESILNNLAPYQSGGDMIKSVNFDKIVFAGLPSKFEAGTPNIGGVIGLGEAINILYEVKDLSSTDYENELCEYAAKELAKIQGLRIIGSPKNKLPIISFTLGQIHPHDVASMLNEKNICIRVGYHCTEPLMQVLGLETGTCRVSFSFYNTEKEIDVLCGELDRISRFFV